MNRHGTAIVTLPSDLEIQITRVFDAPADVIFRAWTTPEYVRRWWSDETNPVVVCDIDLRSAARGATSPGPTTGPSSAGTARTARSSPGAPGGDGGVRGLPRRRGRQHLTLTEAGGVTTLAVTVRHTSKEHRDGHVESGMEGGMQLALDRVEDLATVPAR